MVWLIPALFAVTIPRPLPIVAALRRAQSARVTVMYAAETRAGRGPFRLPT
jgi:hypothetical protein